MQYGLIFADAAVKLVRFVMASPTVVEGGYCLALSSPSYRTIPSTPQQKVTSVFLFASSLIHKSHTEGTKERVSLSECTGLPSG